MITDSGSFSVLQRNWLYFNSVSCKCGQKLSKTGKERNHMLIRLLRFIRTVLAEIVGVLLRETVLA